MHSITAVSKILEGITKFVRNRYVCYFRNDFIPLCRWFHCRKSFYFPNDDHDHHQHDVVCKVLLICLITQGSLFVLCPTIICGRPSRLCRQEQVSYCFTYIVLGTQIVSIFESWHQAFPSLHQHVTKNKLPNTKCQPKFFVMAAIQKRRNSLPSSIFELQQIKKFRLTFGPWYYLVGFQLPADSTKDTNI